MTAFASMTGSARDFNWAWEIRSVNGRGLDIRTRLADGCEALDPAVRAELAIVCKRGNVSVGLKTKRASVVRGGAVNADALQRAIEAVGQVAAQANCAKLEVAPLDLVAILALPGVFSLADHDGDGMADVLPAIKADFATALSAFAKARAAEGAELAQILAAQITEIERLCLSASDVLQQRRDHVAMTLRANVARIIEQTDAVDEGRLAQELAIVAVKADVAEELDRLGAHIVAARDLLTTDGPIGRKFDFLTQEFNREANTLCAKANFTEMTAIGLDLKTVIDQMREQVQNVE
jgi:uncharacterized protein (TIGR00255 family)